MAFWDFLKNTAKSAAVNTVKTFNPLAGIGLNAYNTNKKIQDAKVVQRDGAMEFGVGQGLSNVTEVKALPMRETVEAVKRGEEIKVTPNPVKKSEVTRAKDVVNKNIEKAKEETEYNKRFGVNQKNFGEFLFGGIAKEAGRAITRPAAGFAQDALGRQDQEFQPKGNFSRFLFGDEPVKSLSKEAGEFNEYVNKGIAFANPELAEQKGFLPTIQKLPVALPAAFAFGGIKAMDFDFGIGAPAKRLGKEALERMGKGVAEKYGKEAGERFLKEGSETILREQFGNEFKMVEPMGDLWKSKGRTVFIEPTRANPGYPNRLRNTGLFENVQEAGNNIYKVTLKKDIELSEQATQQFYREQMEILRPTAGDGLAKETAVQPGVGQVDIFGNKASIAPAPEQGGIQFGVDREALTKPHNPVSSADYQAGEAFKMTEANRGQGSITDTTKLKTSEIQTRPDLFQMSRAGELSGGLLNDAGAEPKRVTEYLVDGFNPKLLEEDPIQLGRFMHDIPERGIKAGDTILISGHNRLEMLKQVGIEDLDPRYFNITNYSNLRDATKDSIKSNISGKVTTYDHNIVELLRQGALNEKDIMSVVADPQRTKQILAINNLFKQFDPSVWDNILPKLSQYKSVEEGFVQRKLSTFERLNEAIKVHPSLLKDEAAKDLLVNRIGKIAAAETDHSLKTILNAVERINNAKNAEAARVATFDLFGNVQEKLMQKPAVQYKRVENRLTNAMTGVESKKRMREYREALKILKADGKEVAAALKAARITKDSPASLVDILLEAGKKKEAALTEAAQKNLYHGTGGRGFAAFDNASMREGNQGKGIYLTSNKDVANYHSFGAQDRALEKELGRMPYANEKKAGQVLDVSIKPGAKIKKLDYTPTAKEVEAIKKQGYDGVDFVDEVVLEEWNTKLHGEYPKKGEARTTMIFDSSSVEVKQPKTLPKTTPTEALKKKPKLSPEDDWADNYADKYGELEQRSMALDNEIKTAKTKDKQRLKVEQQKINIEQAKMEEAFIAKNQSKPPTDDVAKTKSAVPDNWEKLEVSPWLSKEGQKIERETQERVIKDYEKYKKQYIKKHAVLDESGNVKSITLNTDDWRELFPEYKGTNAGDVHEAASKLNNRLLQEAFVEQAGKGNNTFLVLAGGGGSGKGTAVKGIIDTADYPIILDQTFSNYEKSVKKLDDAVNKHGFKTQVVMVDREPMGAWEGVVNRAKNARAKGELARTVGDTVAVGDNLTARESIARLAKERPEQPLLIINNNLGFGKHELVDEAKRLDFIERTSYNKDELVTNANNYVKQLYEQGQIDRDIAEGLGYRPSDSLSNALRQPNISPKAKGEGRFIAGESGADTAKLNGDIGGLGKSVEPVQPKTEVQPNKGLKRPELGGSVLKDGEVKQTFRSDKITDETDKLAIIEKEREKAGLMSRDVRTNEKVKELAQELGYDPAELLKSATKGNISDAEVVALRSQIKQDANTVIEFTKKAQSDLANKAKHLETVSAAEQRINTMLKKLIKGGTEAGRTIQSFKLMAQETLDPAFWLRKAQDVAGRELRPAEIEILTKALDEKDQLALLMQIAKLQKSTLTEKMVTIWKAGLLTSPTTHMANIVGNIGMSNLEMVKDVPASALDTLISKFTGKRTLSFNIEGTMTGARRGVDHAVDYLKNGITLDELKKYDIKKQINFSDTPWGRVAQKYTDTIYRTLGAEDKVFREAALQRSLFDQAKAGAKNSKLKGADYTAEVKRIFENPTDEMLRNAINDAEYATFNRETTIGNLASGLRRGAKRLQDKKGFDSLGKAVEVGVETAMPFTRTPAGVASTIIDYSPAGFLTTIANGIKNKNQREFVQGMGRAITGTGIIAAGGVLAAAGLMTGAYPTDSKERLVWEQEGRLPNAIKINGHWLELSRIGIFGALLGVGADVQRAKKDGMGAYEQARAGLASGMKSFSDQSFVSGLNSALEAVKDPDRSLDRYAKNLATSVVPTFFGRLAQVVDPTKRDYKTLKDGFLRKIPFASMKAEAAVDKFGQIVKDERPWYSRAIDKFVLPINVKAIDKKESTQKMMEFYDEGVPVAPSQLSENTSLYGMKLKLTPKQRKDIQGEIGKTQLEVLRRLMKKKSFNALPIDEQSKMVQGMFDDIYNDIKAEKLARDAAYEISATIERAKAGDKEAQDKVDKIKKSGALKNKAVVKDLERLDQIQWLK